MTTSRYSLHSKILLSTRLCVVKSFVSLFYLVWNILNESDNVISAERVPERMRIGFTSLHDVESGMGQIESLLTSLSQRSEFAPKRYHGTYQINRAPGKRNPYPIWKLIQCRSNQLSWIRTLNGAVLQILLSCLGKSCHICQLKVNGTSKSGSRTC